MSEPAMFEIAGFPAAYANSEGDARPFPLLFLHGVMGHHGQFDRYLRFFSTAGFDSYAVSRRGRLGLPPENARGIRTRDYVEDTFRVIDALEREPVIVGHSLGALLAQKVAEAGRCRAAVLVAPTPPRGVGMRPPLSAIPFYLNGMPAILSGRPKLIGYDIVSRVAMSRVPEPERRRIYADFVPESGLIFRGLALGTPVDSSKVQCPILCVAGAHDGVYPPRIVRAIARRYKAGYQEYPEHGHWIIEEPGWEESAGGILNWLEKLAS